jgi:hypothetical protein
MILVPLDRAGVSCGAAALPLHQRISPRCPAGKNLHQISYKALAKALEFKGFQLWQPPCLFHLIRLQSVRIRLAGFLCNLHGLCAQLFSVTMLLRRTVASAVRCP